MKKLVTLFLLLTMAISACLPAAALAEEPLTVNLLLYGDESKRMSELKENEFHQVALEQANADLQISYVPWSEYPYGKVELMMASGEEFMCLSDLSPTAKFASKGYLADMAPYVEECCPDLIANTDWEANKAIGSIGDSLYLLPVGYKPNEGENYVILARTDLMAEVGYETLSSVEDVENFYMACKELHPELNGFGAFEIKPLLPALDSGDVNVTFADNSMFIYQDENAADDKLYSFYESDYYRQICEITRRWNQMGIISNQSLTNSTEVSAAFDNGLAMFRCGANDRMFEFQSLVSKSVPTATLRNFFIGDAEKHQLVSRGSYATAFNISAAVGDNPELLKAYLRVINLFQKNKELVDMWVYGIEGVDFTYTEEGRLDRICTDTLIYDWLPVNVNFRSYPTWVTQDMIDIFNNWDGEETVYTKSSGFLFDSTPVETEYTQLLAVESEYLQPITLGFKDYDENIDEAIERLKKAGIDAYVEEYQRQFSEWMAAK